MTERAKLYKRWGARRDINLALARAGARRLGLTPETIAAMEEMAGYQAVMESMREIGEDSISSYNAARKRLIALVKDKEWGKKLMAGQIKPRREVEELTEIIARHEYLKREKQKRKGKRNIRRPR